MVANDTTQDTMVGDTFDINGQVFEVVEELEHDQYRLNDGQHDVVLAFNELEERPRVTAPPVFVFSRHAPEYLFSR
jgi:hypothetical protein